MRFFEIVRAELPRWQPQLAALEQLSSYPLGADRFRIDHGADYLAFFERLGRPRYYAMEEDGRLIAVGCAVLRDASPRGSPRRWYVADLKVHPDHRGRGLPVQMLRRGFVQNYVRCPRGYAVAMDPDDGREPPAFRLLRHFELLPAAWRAQTSLAIWSGDADQARRASPILVAARGPLHFVSLRGVKDLVVERTAAPLPLWHVRHGARTDARVADEPQAGATHMWCAPRDGSLSRALVEGGFAPAASATVLHHRLRGFDASDIDTSEI